MKYLLSLIFFLAPLAFGSFPVPTSAMIMSDAYAKKRLVATVSFYTARETCPGGKEANCIAADGTRPIANQTLACPRRYPLGSVFFLLGKVYKCTDRTAKRLDGRYDIFWGDYEEAKKLGLKRNVTVLPLRIGKK